MSNTVPRHKTYRAGLGVGTHLNPFKVLESYMNQKSILFIRFPLIYPENTFHLFI